MGALDYKKHKLSKLLDDIVELQEMTLEDLNEKYGNININLDDGSYEEREDK